MYDPTPGYPMLLFLMACGFETSLKANVPDPDAPRDTAIEDSACLLYTSDAADE